MKAVILPVIIVVMVLGSIIGGHYHPDGGRRHRCFGGHHLGPRLPAIQLESDEGSRYAHLAADRQ